MITNKNETILIILPDPKMSKPRLDTIARRKLYKGGDVGIKE